MELIFLFNIINMRPSFIISRISGIVILIATILFIVNIKSISKDTIKLIQLLLLLAIGLGNHAITHYYEELYFNFNPLTNNWAIYDKKRERDLLFNNRCVFKKKRSHNTPLSQYSLVIVN